MNGIEPRTLVEFERTNHALGRPVNVELLLDLATDHAEAEDDPDKLCEIIELENERDDALAKKKRAEAFLARLIAKVRAVANTAHKLTKEAMVTELNDAIQAAEKGG